MQKIKKAGAYNSAVSYGAYMLQQEYITTYVLINTIGNTGATTTYPSGSGNGCYFGMYKIGDMLGSASPYYPIGIHTSQLNWSQLAIAGSDSQNVAKVVFTDGRMSTITGEAGDIKRYDSGIVTNNACLYTTGITYGCGLLLGVYGDDETSTIGASLFNIPAQSINTNLNLDSLLSYGGWLPGAGDFWAVIAINRLYLAADAASVMIETMLQVLGIAGISPEKTTVYQSYSTGNTSLSLGMDATGKWGEVLDEL